jgi:CDP-glycerol glycerophosphotransferase (TagB/SpsB family)
MPTWRASLVGKSMGKTNDKALNDNFRSTEYFTSWYAFLHADELKELSERYGYEIVFFPHANIQPYLRFFEVPSYIRTLSHREISVQKLFLQSSVMVTDYSSVAFEMAMLRKPVIYYQFDYETFYGGGHAFEQGYFNFENDGFGPVCTERSCVFDALEKILKNEGAPEPLYETRMKNFFRYHDTNNCHRVFHAIRSMTQPRGTDDASV